jgi:hypothetical protein
MLPRFAFIDTFTVCLLASGGAVAQQAPAAPPGAGGYGQRANGLPPGISKCQQAFESQREPRSAVYVVTETPSSWYLLPWVYWGPMNDRHPICYMEPGAKIAGTLRNCAPSRNPTDYGRPVCEMRIGVKDDQNRYSIEQYRLVPALVLQDRLNRLGWGPHSARAYGSR